MKKYSLLVSGLFVCVLLITGQSCTKENQAPVAQFTIDPTTGNELTTFYVDASGTSDPNDDAGSLQIMWDWEGDGTFDTQYATKKTSDHKYSKPGAYTVVMVVKDPRGLTDTLAVPLTVTSSNLPPEAPFDPSPADGAVVKSVKPWMKWSSSDPDGDPMFFTCYFGKTNPPAQLIASQMLGTFYGGDLEYGTTYYWKIKVRDSKGNITMGPVWSFTTYDLHFQTITDARDGQTYKAIQIGNTWWMAENMRYNNAGSYCYDNTDARCTTYGRLYTWDAAKTACPAGWHLPTISEFGTLASTAGGTSVAGTVLKDNELDLWKASLDEPTNDLAFSALPAGRRYDSGVYAGLGYYAQFFSSTEYNSKEAYNMTIGYDYSDVFIYNYKKAYAISVRCVKD